MSGYRVGAVLAPGERPWDCQWEQDARIDDGHAHDWETVLLGASDHDRVEEVVRCASCHAPRCGSSHDDDPCMKRRHHSDCHRYLSGRSDHLGGMASSCACGGAS